MAKSTYNNTITIPDAATDSLAATDNTIGGDLIKNDKALADLIHRHYISGDTGVVIGLGDNNCACGINSVALGGLNNNSENINSTVLGGRGSRSSGENSSVVGGASNATFGNNSVVLGGSSNSTSGVGDVAIGGLNNHASGGNSVISGGSANNATGLYSGIIGGTNNDVCGSNSFVGGSHDSWAAYDNSAIVGGYSNYSAAINSVILGGNHNRTYIPNAVSNNALFIGHDSNYAHSGAGHTVSASGTSCRFFQGITGVVESIYPIFTLEASAHYILHIDVISVNTSWAGVLAITPNTSGTVTPAHILNSASSPTFNVSNGGLYLRSGSGFSSGALIEIGITGTILGSSAIAYDCGCGC